MLKTPLFRPVTEPMSLEFSDRALTISSALIPDRHLWFVAFGFDVVHAVSISGGVDVLSVGAIDYTLFKVGDWLEL